MRMTERPRVSKYVVSYEVEAADMASASEWAHQLLFIADQDAVSIKVEAKERPTASVSGLAFGEVSPRVYDHIIEGSVINAPKITAEDG